MIPTQKYPGTSPSWKRTLYIMLFAQIVSTIGFSSVFPFLPLYVKSLGSMTRLGADTLAGLVYSGQALTMMIASPIWGSLADRWGRKPMVVRATLGGAAILVLMAFVRSAEELVLLRMVQGLITGVIGSANALVAAAVPRERMGYAMGVMQVAMGVGVGLGPMLGGLVADAFGYDAAFFVTAALLVIGGLIVLFGVRENFVPPERNPKQRPAFWRTWGQIFSTDGVMVIYFLRFINQAGRMVYMPILPMFVLLLLDNPARVNSVTGVMTGISSAATAAFALVMGYLGDRFGHRRILVACALASCGIYFLQSMVQSEHQLLALQFCVGITLGGIATSVSALLAKFTRSGEEGAVYGLDNAVTSGARVVGPMVGVSIAAFFGLRAVFAVVAVFYLAVALLAVWRLPAKQSNPLSGRH